MGHARKCIYIYPVKSKSLVVRFVHQFCIFNLAVAEVDSESTFLHVNNQHNVDIYVPSITMRTTTRRVLTRQLLHSAAVPSRNAIHLVELPCGLYIKYESDITFVLHDDDTLFNNLKLWIHFMF